MEFIYDPSLVLYLPLWELDGSSFMSRDAYGHLCTVTGALWRPNGRYFDGLDDFISCGDNTVLDVIEAITVELWFRDATLSNVDILVANTNGNSLTKGWGLRWSSTNHLMFFINEYGENEASIAFIPDATWHHFVGTYDKASIKIHLDAVKGTDDTYSSSIDYTTAVGTTLGSAPRGTSAYMFTGNLGEVRIYNRALTLLEIQRNYLATKWRYR